MDHDKEAHVLELADLARRIASLEFLLSEGNNPGSVIQMNVVRAEDLQEVLDKARQRQFVVESELRAANETGPIWTTPIWTGSDTSADSKR
jgi:hypothetical protein